MRNPKSLKSRTTPSANALQEIPGVGKAMAADFQSLGITSQDQLKGQLPEVLYLRLCNKSRTLQDRCVFYTMLCAVYFVTEKKPDPDLLCWWNWKTRSTLRFAEVIKSYKRQYDDPVRAMSGTVLKPGKKDDEFPGWIFCEGPEGRTGWVPESWLKKASGGMKLTRDYDALELTAKAGGFVAVDLTECGWALCLDAEGSRGWLPERHLKLKRLTASG